MMQYSFIELKATWGVKCTPKHVRNDVCALIGKFTIQGIKIKVQSKLRMCMLVEIMVERRGGILINSSLLPLFIKKRMGCHNLDNNNPREDNIGKTHKDPRPST